MDYSINGETGRRDSVNNQDSSFGDSRSQMIYANKNQSGMGSFLASATPEHDWIPDEQAVSCYKCHTEFSFFFRRHHCKICRKVFCKNCSLQTSLEIDAMKQKIRTCKQCKEQHNSFNKTLQMQKPLLDDRISSELRQAESHHFSSILQDETPTTPMVIDQIGVKPEYYLRSYSKVSAVDLEDAPAADTSLTRSTGRSRAASQDVEALALMSATNKRAVQNFLSAESEIKHQAQEATIDAEQADVSRVTDSQTNEWLNYKLRAHLDTMIDQVIEEHKIDSHKWRKIIANCTKHAVMTIRPSSRLLADSIDFNSFIKIVTVHHPNQEKCQYVNGFVSKKNVASRRMRTQIDNPKILLLNGSLGYVQEDDDVIDMQAEINQQDSFVRIIRAKINALQPDIIFVEKDASRLALQLLEEDKITVVTNTTAKMLKMIARQTQTIVCPSTNLLDRRFVVGYCLNFRIEQVKKESKNMQHHSLAETTSLMYLEGCQAKLGCSIVLSGPDAQELKTVRRAIQSCLETARILLLERELFRFLVPEIQKFIPEQTGTNLQQDEPEVTFREPGSSQDKFQIEEVRNSLVQPQGQQAEDLAHFELFGSPYLFQKHMWRREIVFEHFSLVQPAEIIPKHLTVPKLAEDKTFMLTNMKVENRNSGDSDSKLDPQLNEASIRKRLHNMCFRPRRTIIPFLDGEKDMSLFSFLKKRCEMLNQNCSEEGCGKAMMQHYDYWYHGEGCIEIKFKHEPSKPNQSAPILHVFCAECNRVVLKREKLPAEVLEISFFKFIEQFFYNTKVTISPSRNQEFLGDHPACPHSLFRSCELIFRFKQIKTVMKFEKLDPYSLDLYHFGLEKGTVTEQKKVELVNAKLAQLRGNLIKTFHFMLTKIETLSEFMDSGIEEVKHNSILEAAQLESMKSTILGLMNKFRYKTSNQLIFMFKEIYAETIDPGATNLSQLIDSSQISEESASGANHGGDNPTYSEGTAGQIKSLMQFNRLHKIVSARTCELLFFIRHLFSLVRKDFVNVAFPKKFFTSNEQIVEHAIQVANLTTKQEIQRQQDMFNGGVDDLARGLEKKPTRASEELSTAKSTFKEVIQFETQLSEATFIASLVEQNVFIPPGFNQNCVSLVKYGEGAKKHMDLSALIACALSSNLYLNGLAHLDYLSMQSKIKPFEGKFINDDSQVKQSDDYDNQIMLAAAERFDGDVEQVRKVQLQQDVLNDNMKLEMVEQELLGYTQNCFKVSFSTHQDNANLEVLVDDVKRKQIVHRYEDCDEFYSRCESIASMDSLQVPFPQSMFDELGQLQFNIGMVSHKSKHERQNAARQSSVSTRRNSNTQKIQSLAKVANKKSMDLPCEIVNYCHQEAYKEIYHVYHEKIDFCVKVYCPKQFEALRKLYCGNYNDLLHSVFRSEIWSDNSGGKSASTFFKSFDNKFILKAVDSKEIKMFNDMSSSYFEYLSRSFTQQCPTAIAKVLGLFRITVKRGKSTEHFSVILMENLLLNVDDSVAIKYDLKGSRRNRFIQRKSAQQVTLDNNLLFDRKSRPLPMQNSMKRLLKIAIANDSLYLTKHSIIDYSMFVIINPLKRTIRVGIIDYIQQYTFEKELESFMKQTISNEDPTIIPPEQYKRRFRTAMDKYFVALVPDEEEKVSSVMERRFGASKINWSTKVSSESALQAALIHRMQKIIDESERKKQEEAKKAAAAKDNQATSEAQVAAQ